ncbi:MAG TPA: ribonuclease HII [Thermoanaerobaculia bacterium]|nr:ribonuclease HII [Thermoanaerobaculia bacterium]
MTETIRAGRRKKAAAKAVSRTAAATTATATPGVPPTATAAITDLFAEACRLRLLCGLEELLGQCGFARIAGVDEAGRGSLAGPVVAAAVVVDPRYAIPGVDDSKCLTAAERERLAAVIRRSALASAVVAVDPGVIDSINILEATRKAMVGALRALSPRPDCAVIDAVRLRGLRFPCLPVVRGDAISYAIASASILAKVERDRMMVALHRRYPQYGFADHKGYSVPEHLAALRTYGPSPVHRLTYRPVVPRLPEGAC